VDPVIWNPLLPSAILTLLGGALGALTLAAAWRARRSLPLWANLCAVGLRGIALVCALVLIARPETVKIEQREHRPALLIAIDASQSLRLKDSEGGATRAEECQQALAALITAASNHGWEVQAYDLGARAETRHPSDVNVRADAPVSALGEGLAQAAGQRSAYGAAILISDGCVNLGRALPEAAALLRERGVPLFAIMPGRVHPAPPDARLSEASLRLEAESTAGLESTPPRAGQALLIEARAQLAKGGPDLNGPLADTFARLKVLGPPPRGSSGAAPAWEFVEVDALRHRLHTAPAWTPIKLKFTPPSAGIYRLRLSVDPMSSETQLANNAAYLSVEVLPPRRRVVYANSRLGHAFRWMKPLLNSETGGHVEFIPDFVKPEGGDEAWPIEAALGAWLREGSASGAEGGTLIWEDPAPQHLSRDLQMRLRAGIETGDWSVIWILNGPTEPLVKALAGTPLEDLFLFKELSPSKAESAQQPEAVASQPAAAEHPATQWAFGSSAPQDPWVPLGPAYSWINFDVPRANTQVLLKAGARPLLCVGKVGQGRVGLLGNGETWRWLMAEPVRGERSAADMAREFWRRFVAWAASAPAAEEPPVRLFLPRDRWELGEPIQARVTVRGLSDAESPRFEYALAPWNEGHSAERPAQWNLLHADAAGTRIGLQESTGRRVLTGRLNPPRGAGEWLIWVRAIGADNRELGFDRGFAEVEGSELEERSISPDKAALQAAVQAAAPGGRLLPPSAEEVQRLIEDLEPYFKPEIVSKEERRWAFSPGALGALLALALCVDIWLRRG